MDYEELLTILSLFLLAMMLTGLVLPGRDLHEPSTSFHLL